MNGTFKLKTKLASFSLITTSSSNMISLVAGKINMETFITGMENLFMTNTSTTTDPMNKSKTIMRRRFHKVKKFLKKYHIT